MDENILLQTLNATLQRHAKTVASYEVEITNLVAENIKLQLDVESAKLALTQDAAEDL